MTACKTAVPLACPDNRSIIISDITLDTEEDAQGNQLEGRDRYRYYEFVSSAFCDDFNFDCMKDFAVWQIDDGMGTYDIHRIFVFQPQTSFFKELQPNCGDGFVNLRIEKKRKALISTYWTMNVAKQCVARFPQRGT
ncbi:XAC2610-related protein [Pseudomonas chlororaphis]|uniref:XAC2610-related protein n=1 Tax=Pseudomonas chlororaphis TaxID=587753 RepID=UPI0003D31266|nr:hypothetical protein [Pseudomonas chlororaphis]ETD38279.1 hypothetical protein U724_12855 [Pseudomonas chlororaphis subsp. aurantiaca PB-St2]